jgi:hypothetical protein
MIPTHHALEDDALPIDDQLLGELYRSDPRGLPTLVDTIPPATRATLAIFCYRRAHLQGLAVAIATTCSEEDLIDQGGFLGSILISRTRTIPDAPPKPSARVKITLSSGKFSTPA